MKALVIGFLFALTTSLAVADEPQQQGNGKDKCGKPGTVVLTGSNADCFGGNAHRVIGIASSGDENPLAIFDRGCEAANFEAKACAASGHLSNGSRCYAIFQGCDRTDWVGPRNSQAVIGFQIYLQGMLAELATTTGGLNSEACAAAYSKFFIEASGVHP